ncbi:MAG: polysaccharide deacetylase family protein [Solirubrobacteraceae bacterium]
MPRGRKIAATVAGAIAGAIAVGLTCLAGLLVLAPTTDDFALRLAAPAVLPPPPLTVREARLAVREHAAVNRVLRYTRMVSSGGSRVREIALTFDDGPSPFTPPIIAILQRLHVPATFFQVGAQIANFPRIARQELEVGLGIGDHTLTHPFLAVLPPAQQRAEIIGDARQIHAYGAPYPRLFRPPYESFSHVTLAAAAGVRMLMVLWSVDTRDFSRPGARQIADTAISGARPGAIILLHDGGGLREQTVAALPLIVRGLRQRRYRLVTIGRLLLEDPPSRSARGRPRHR